MRLELATFEVQDLVFSDTTGLRDGILYIDRDKISKLVMQDHSFDGAEAHLVRPGESTRIINILDAVEPRHKVSGPSTVFPGLLGPPMTVGQGRTHRLANVSVMVTSNPLADEPSFWRDSVLDMSGPGAQYNLFANTLNLVLELKPRSELTRESGRITDYNQGSQRVQQYQRSVRTVACKVAAYLAECSSTLKPDQVDAYELGPTDPGLPKVAFSCQVVRHLVYGQRAGWQPTFVHPNEFFDGFLINPFNPPACGRESTYHLQNHPVVHHLYQRHGKEVNFFGVLLAPSQVMSLDDKERSTHYAAKLLRMMGIDGLVLTWPGSGNIGVDTMMLCEKCEHLGIKTTVINSEMARTPDDPGVSYFPPEADAVVCTGNYERPITLPPVERLIGGDKLTEPEMDASGQLTLTLRYLYGATNVTGANRLAGVPY